jgi:hypothetical protein
MTINITFYVVFNITFVIALTMVMLLIHTKKK